MLSSAAASRTGVREEQHPHQRGESGLRRPPPAAPMGALALSRGSAPRCSCPAAPPCAEQSPGRCPRPRPVPLHQEPGSERSSSRTRGAHLAYDGNPPAAPTGALALLRAPLNVPSDAALSAEQSPGRCPSPRPVPLRQEPGSERSSSRTRGANLASDGPHLQRQWGLSRGSAPRCSCPAMPPCAEQSPEKCPRCFLVPLHQEPGSERSSSRTRGRTWPPTAPTCSTHGLSRCSTPRCSCPATPPCAEQSPKRSPSPRPVPQHQEPGSERSSSRTRGAHLASDGPHLQHPRGLSRCSTLRCLCPATPLCAEQSPKRCPSPRPVPLHQKPGSERSSSRTRGAHLASDGSHLQHSRGLSRCYTSRCSCPATPPCAEQSPGDVL